jgi:predicted signal transduction protein with EAL and GGDEF domain
VPFSLKASIGLAIFPDEAANLDALLARASLNAASARVGGGSLEHVAVEEGLHGAL